MLVTSIRNRIKLYREFINQEDSEELIDFFGKKKLPKRFGEGLMNISAAFGMQGYSSVSSAIDRVKKRMVSDKGLRKRIDEIKQQIIG